jgi:predicted nucleic acid-binding protein
MSLYEINENPYEEIKQHIENFVVNNASIFVSKTHKHKMETMVNEIMQTGIKIKDATHLACAIYAECDYFISTDGRVLKYQTDKIKIVNPMKFVEIWRA